MRNLSRIMKGRWLLAVVLMFWMTGMISCVRKFHFNDYRGYYPDQDYKEHHYSGMHKRSKDMHKKPVKPATNYAAAPSPEPAPAPETPPPPSSGPIPGSSIPDPTQAPPSEPVPTPPTTPTQTPPDTTKLFFQFGL